MFENFFSKLREKNGGTLPFEGTAESLKERLKQVGENKNIGSDILFMITYMASITTADVTRPEIFAHTSQRKEYLTSRYIKKVEIFVKKWGYSYAQGLEIVAERVKNKILQSMLNRYGNAIGSGVPDEEFLRLELSTVRSVYRNTCEQGFSMLQKWGDAYIALMLSGTIVSIIIMVSIAIYAPDDLDSTLNGSYLLVLGISLFGLITMYKSIPDDQKCHGLSGRGTYEQEMIHRMERIVLPVVAISTVILMLIGINFGVVALFAGLLLLPMGILGIIDDTNIISRDEDFVVFIRGLGSIMGGKGFTVTPALAEVDRKSLVILGDFIDAAYSKLNLGLDEIKVWNRFTANTGSNLIYKYMRIFMDSIKLGGNPIEIGKIVSTSMLEMTLLRQKREMLSTGFIVLLIPMHVSMIAIFVFLHRILINMSRAITNVMETFESTAGAMSGSSGSVGGSMAGSINIFVNFPEDKMGTYLITMLMIITISNILAGKIVKGGDRYIFYFLGSLLFGLTGIIYLVTPFVVDMIFQIPTFEAI